MAFLQDNIEITSNTAVSGALISNYSGYLNAGSISYGTGGLLVFGNNSFGSLGPLNALNSQSSPVLYSPSNWLDVAFLRNGQGSLAVREDNKVIASLQEIVFAINKQTPNSVGLTYPGKKDFWTNITATAGTGSQWFALALQSNGTLWSWGDNNFGQLGLSDITNRSSPIQVGALSVWTQVIAGSAYGLAIQSNSTLWSWGNNNTGQLGLSDTVIRSSPVQVGALSTWTKIAAGTTMSLAIQSNSTLWSWGGNDVGQLGLSDITNRSSPIQVGALSVWTGIACGYGHSLAIQSNGTLWSWGNNSLGALGLSNITNRSSPVQVGALSVWTKIACGYRHSLALQSNGTLWSWGGNSFGQLGSSNITHRSSPAQVGALLWKEIAASDRHSLAIQSNGTLWVWGGNSYGQLGLGDLNRRSSPVQVGTLSNWSKIAAGTGHALAIQSDSNLWIWGVSSVASAKFQFQYTYDKISTSDSNAYARNYNFKNIHQSTDIDIPLIDQAFQFNDFDTGRFHFVGIRTDGTAWSLGNNSFGQLGFDNPFKKIVTGSEFSLALQSDGTLWSWGKNDQGQLGLNTSTGFSFSVPNQIGTLLWKEISGGQAHSLIIQSNGTLWSMGDGVFGRLGNNLTSPFSSPVQVGALSVWTKITASRTHSLAIQSNGTLWAWGYNFYGQLGLSDITDRSSPVQVGSLSNWSKLNDPSTQAFHSLAIQSNGTLWSWGWNGYGQLGLSDITNRSTPVQVGIESYWSQVTTGFRHTLALQSNGTIWSCGNGFFGALGLSDQTDRSSFTQIGTLSNWSQVACGYYYSLALQSNGTLWAWGNNSYGQLGTSNIINYSSPVQIGSLSNWSQPSPGGFHGLAIQNNKILFSWGLNASGQLGTGNVVNTSSPVQANQPVTNISLLTQIGTESNWNQVHCGDFSTLLINTSNVPYVFGKNNVYQLGLSDTINRSSPTQITYVSSILDASLDDNNIGLVDANGSFWLSGNYNQAILINAFNSYPIPYYVGTIPTARTWTKISAGGQHFLALQSDGTLWSCGYNANNGQLGLNDLTSRSSPAQVGALLWKEISAGSLFSVAIQSNGTLWAWGRGNAGQLGNNSSGLTTQSSPVRIGALSVWTKVSAGGQYCLAIQSNGTLWAWGSNFLGALGNNSTVGGTSSPIQIGALSSWAQITAGGCSAAIQSDGTLWAWGDNQRGQLGQNDTISRSSPTQIGSLSVWTRISAGAGGECLALQSNGTLWAWGNNFYGQLGLNTSTNYSSPVQVGNLSNWTQISSSSADTSIGGVSLALQSNGTLWAWGNNSYSQLALTNIGNYSSPVQVGSLSNWTQISAGTFHTLAIQSNSSLWSWGANSRGQLGLAGTLFTYPQNALTAKNEYSKVSTNSNNFLLTKSNGQIWSFGINTFGALGLNTSTENFSPVQIINSNLSVFINTPIKVLTTSNSTALLIK